MVHKYCLLVIDLVKLDLAQMIDTNNQDSRHALHSPGMPFMKAVLLILHNILYLNM